MTDKHTPAPEIEIKFVPAIPYGGSFEFTYDDTLWTTYIIKNSSDIKIAEANAKHIVKCVNIHEDLVATLEAIKETLLFAEGANKVINSDSGLMDEINKTLKKARGEV